MGDLLCRERPPFLEGSKHDTCRLASEGMMPGRHRPVADFVQFDCRIEHEDGRVEMIEVGHKLSDLIL
jgi:hypothetical protein